MAGYSGTPLLKKIGIKSGDRLLFCNEPSNFRSTLGELPDKAIVVRSARLEVNVAVLFSDRQSHLQKNFPVVAKSLQQNGMLWIGWPKKSSGVATDLNENLVREIGLANGLVDTKVCAIDETWSGLRFVIRLKDRKS
jgi:hypothetical protein